MEEPARRRVLDDHIQKLLNAKRSLVISDDKHESIVGYLQNPGGKVSAHFRHWIKQRGFQMMAVPALGVANALVVPAKCDSPSEGPQFLKVVPTSDIL